VFGILLREMFGEMKDGREVGDCINFDRRTRGVRRARPRIAAGRKPTACPWSASREEWLERPRTALGTKVWEFPAAADRRSITVLKTVARSFPLPS